MEDLTRIFEKYKYDQSIQNKSKAWFSQQALLLAKTPINQTALFKQETKVASVLPGNLYMFYYDPKNKETLPYYDRFPLVFPFQKSPQGFLGLNMHYLPTYYRVQLMTRLMQFAKNKSFDESTKIKYSWSLIKGVSKFKAAEVCIKSYLKDHVKSTFIQVKPENWHTAMMLPVEKFIGSSKLKVWGDSLNGIAK